MAKIFIPFEKYKNIGGPTTFMLNLKKELDNHGYRYSKSLQFAKGMFFPITEPIKNIQKIKRAKGKIIQRLDGVYYPSKHGKNYINKNKLIKDIYENYSDMIIFQSKYSKQQCFEMLGSKQKNQYKIICNGTDKSIFYPGKKKVLQNKVTFITTGNIRNQDMIMPVIEALDILKAKNYNFEFRLVRPLNLSNREDIVSKEYVVYKDKMSIENVAKELRQCDIFIYSHLNPPCPNSVIEAVSCGLPVVSFDSGSIKELCFFNTDLLAYVSSDIFQKYKDFNSQILAEKLELSIKKYAIYKLNALKHAHLYSMTNCAKAYIDVFTEFFPNSSKKNIFNLFLTGALKRLYNKTELR